MIFFQQCIQIHQNAFWKKFLQNKSIQAITCFDNTTQWFVNKEKIFSSDKSFFFFFGLFLLMNFRFFNSRKNSSVTFREIQQKLVLLYFFDIQISVLWHLTMMKSFYLLTIQLKVCKSQSNRLQTFMLLFCLLVCFCFLSFDCLADKNGKVDIFKIYLWWYRKQYKSNYSVGIIHQVKNILLLWWLCWKEWWEGEGQSHPFLK